MLVVASAAGRSHRSNNYGGQATSAYIMTTLPPRLLRARVAEIAMLASTATLVDRPDFTSHTSANHKQDTSHNNNRKSTGIPVMEAIVIVATIVVVVMAILVAIVLVIVTVVETHSRQTHACHKILT